MDQTISLSDETASRVNRFAAAHDISVDDAYELLASVALETLDGMELSVTQESGRLTFECPACEAVFDAADDAVTHDCSPEKA